MASQAQIQANRTNAQKSTGPRTAHGKAVVAQNAVKHGLLARQAVIAGEDPGQFETYRDQMLAELNPEGNVESMLANRAVGLAWRLLRAERLQNEAFDSLYTDETTNPLAKLQQAALASAFGVPQTDPPEDAPDLTLGRIVVKDFANTRVLDRLLMYERRLEHSLYKAIAELQRLRLLRQWTPPEDQETGDWPAARRACPEQRRGIPSPGEGCTCPRFPDRAKQTQFPRTTNPPKVFSQCGLRQKCPNSRAEKTNPIKPNRRRCPQRSRTDPKTHRAAKLPLGIDERPPSP
ncbi:MAG: hypothetical protein ACYTAS_06820 [Planctomycetota bacterium]|jgi:hypothetical protein